MLRKMRGEISVLRENTRREAALGLDIQGCDSSVLRLGISVGAQAIDLLI